MSVYDKQFQVRGLKRANEFHNLYKNLQQGLIHENNKPTKPERQAVHEETDNSVTGELERLAALHQKGILKRRRVTARQADGVILRKNCLWGETAELIPQNPTSGVVNCTR